MNISYGGALSCCPTGVLSLAPVAILVVPILGCFGPNARATCGPSFQSGHMRFDIGTVPSPVRNADGANSCKTKHELEKKQWARKTEKKRWTVRPRQI